MPVFYNLTNEQFCRKYIVDSDFYNYLSMTVGIITSSYTNLVNIGSSANAKCWKLKFLYHRTNESDLPSDQCSFRIFSSPEKATTGVRWCSPITFYKRQCELYWEMIETAASSLGYTLPASCPTVSNPLLADHKYQNRVFSTMQLFNCTAVPDDGVFTDRLNLRVAEGIGTNWFNRGGTGTANGTGTITSSSLMPGEASSLSPTQQEDRNALPIELLGFSAQKYDKDVIPWLDHRSEINNDYFTVERSADNNEYVPLEIIRGAENSTSIINYNTFDKDPLFGVSLLPTQTNGLWRSIHVLRSQKIEFGRKPGISVSPNPVSGQGAQIFSSMKFIRII